MIIRRLAIVIWAGAIAVVESVNPDRADPDVLEVNVGIGAGQREAFGEIVAVDAQTLDVDDSIGRAVIDPDAMAIRCVAKGSPRR